MKGKLCLLLLLILFCSHLPFSLGQNVQFYKLVLQWPVSFCNGDVWCHTVPTDDFTIHGLRHFDATWSIVKNCRDIDLRRDELNEIREQLQRAWPNLKGKDIEFWKEQWKKHGTCSGKRPVEYFQYALRLKSNYRLLSHFRLIGCAPCESLLYTSDRIRDIIYGTTRQTPEIKCNRNRRGSDQLFEITFCFNNSGSPIHCNFDDSDCPQRDIIFPSEKTLPGFCPDPDDTYRDMIFP